MMGTQGVTESRDGDQSPPTIRVATYNVLNLFDHEDDPALTGDQEDMDEQTTEGRCRSLAAAIRAVDADVLALQEVESESALRWFRDTYLADMGYDHLVSLDVGYYRGVENAVLSRFPLSNASAPPNIPINDVVRHASPMASWDRGDGKGGWAKPRKGDTTTTYQRTPLRVDVETDAGYELTLFVVHHKSGNHRYRREGEALKLVELVEEVRAQSPERNIVLLGDFNASPWERSMDVYRDAGFIDVLADPGVERVKTHHSGGAIDFILMNSASHRELIPGSQHVHQIKLAPDDFNWKSEQQPDDCPSDHRPISVDLADGDRS